VEEAHEVVEAIDRGEPEPLREELGDLLFQIVFQAELARAKGWFALDDVIRGIAGKMERRHPWVFGDEQVTGEAATRHRWEVQKAKEKQARGALGGVPRALPALLRALRVGEKAAAHGYDWPDASGVRVKVDEELAELDAALSTGDDAAAEQELGDVLFALASLGRKRGLDPEAALRGTLERFTRRFRHAELAAEGKGVALRDLDDAARDGLWEDAKAATA
ncbi:MAG: nucleoside triphosphate pyrophosphohydrolase, partial [Myxococcota bacterium]